MAHSAKILQDKSKVPDNLVPSLLSLYAGLAEYNGEKHTSFYSRYYSTLPSLFFKFAYKARVDSGHRLLQWCACHALDPRANPLVTTNASLFWLPEEAQLGIILENDIPSSMKDVTYQVKIPFTKRNVIICECTCKCGGEK